MWAMTGMIPRIVVPALTVVTIVAVIVIVVPTMIAFTSALVVSEPNSAL